MSGVPKRLRKPTELDPLVKARRLKEFLYSHLMKDTNFAKKHRYLQISLILNKIDSVIEALMQANRYPPRNDTLLERRKSFQEEAMYNLDRALQEYGTLTKITNFRNSKVHMKKILHLINMFKDVNKAIKRWETNTKLVTKA